MGFKKVEKKGARASKLDVPAIHLGKNTSTFNHKFCTALGLTVVGTKVGVDLMYDAEENKFALRIGTKDVKDFDTIVPFNKSHQCQIYLRGMLKSLGYAIIKTDPQPLEYDEENDIWTFDIPDCHRIDKQGRAEKKSLKKDKSDVVRKSKRNKSERNTAKVKKKLRSKA